MMLFHRRRYHRKNSLGLFLLIVSVVLLMVGALFFLRSNQNTDINLGKSNTNVLQKIWNELPAQSLREYVNSLVVDWDIETATPSPDISSSPLVASLAIVSDSHADAETFAQVIGQLKLEKPQLLLHLGDISTAGELEELHAIKNVLDESGIAYQVLPGDHDYNWLPQHDLTNFRHVFGFISDEEINRTLEIEGFLLIFYNNSLSSQGVASSSLQWLEERIQDPSLNTYKGIFVFSSTPPVNPYFLTKEDVTGSDMLQILSQSKISQVFSGDIHIFARYTDEETGINITTVGASGSYKNPLPQFVVLELYENGSFDIKAKPVVELESVD
jgi:predicted phosphodiesterase